MGANTPIQGVDNKNFLIYISVDGFVREKEGPRPKPL